MSELTLDQIIWQIVASIPAGKVATYGQVAKQAGFPNHARYVGATLKKLPKNTSLPWHRVLNAKGEISFPVNSEPYKKQKALLADEGVNFLKGRINFKLYGWQV